MLIFRVSPPFQTVEEQQKPPVLLLSAALLSEPVAEPRWRS
jgi:hypothetical protein